MTDRTIDLQQRAQFYRQTVSTKYKDRFIQPAEVSSSNQSFMTEAVKLHFSLTQSGQKLEALKTVMKESSLFNSQHTRIKSLADSVDDELKRTQMKLEELQQILTEGQCAEAVKAVLQGRLFTLTKEFKQVLQTRTKTLRSTEEKKRELSSARSYSTSTTVRSEPSFLEET